jgi:CRISPR/Cas system-associated endonuclease Cas1
MLNYCYVVEAGRLAKALTARGLVLPIGYLHSDKKGRNSLVWDAIEPLRPSIDAKVFAFIEAHEFARSDFPQSGYNVHRLSRDVTQLLLHKASLSSREIEEAAEWMVGTIMRCGGAPKAKVKRVGRKRGSLARETAT